MNHTKSDSMRIHKNISNTSHSVSQGYTVSFMGKYCTSRLRDSVFVYRFSALWRSSGICMKH